MSEGVFIQHPIEYESRERIDRGKLHGWSVQRHDAVQWVWEEMGQMSVCELIGIRIL